MHTLDRHAALAHCGGTARSISGGGSRIDAAKEHVLVDRTSNRLDVRGPHVQEPIGIGLDAELAAILAAQLLAAFLLQSCCRVARLTWTSLQADHSERMLRD